MVDRTELSRLLAKAIAYKNCGSEALAAEYARKLVLALELEEILR